MKDGVPDLVNRRRTMGLDDCSGVFIEVLFVPNEDFPLRSLSLERSGIEVVAVTELGQSLAQATVFVPDGKLSIFETKIRGFAPDDSSKVPRNVPLVSSLESIRRAATRSFWTDPVEEFPTVAGKIWWEVWLRRGQDSTRFRRHARVLSMRVSGRELRFPDRTVLLVEATLNEMTRSAELLDSIAELRSPPPLDLEFLCMDSRDAQEFALDLADRIQRAPSSAPAVCLLDTGVDIDHPLLRAALRREDALTCFGDDLRDCFGGTDWHGTGSAGLALFGLELGGALARAEAWTHSHHIESVKYIPSIGANEPDLYGEVTKEAIARAAAANPHRVRTIVTTVTAKRIAAGEPSSWSSAIDQLCSGAEDDVPVRRLIVVSAGNVLPHTGYRYPDTNHVETIEEPAQAWNALTVGAFTARLEIAESHATGWHVVAPAGDMSPSSRTTIAWHRVSNRSDPPFKPDLVCEGGNWAAETPDAFPEQLDSLAPISTRRYDGIGASVLARFGGTSGAAALAANLAARIQSEYPSAWPETVRALLVHSCRYTPAMEARFADLSPKQCARAKLRCFGYGVPDLERARYSARNEVTLVSEREIQPFQVDPTNGKGRTNEMHLHQLPWPADLLESLGNLEVRMRVTLSYFVEPNPGRRGVSGDAKTIVVDPARYPSFSLRFEVAKAGESPEALVQRINAADRTGEVDEGTDYHQWDLGRNRTRGSLHSDVWRGHAADLADKRAIAVRPVNGWWRFRHKTPEVCERMARYSLIVSIETDVEQVDLYTSVLNLVEMIR